MKKWMQSPMRIKRIYLLAAVGIVVILIGIVATLFSKSDSPTAAPQTVQPAPDATQAVASSADAADSNVTQVPLNKTREEAQAEGLLDDEETVSKSSKHNRTSTSSESSDKQTVDKTSVTPNTPSVTPPAVTSNATTSVQTGTGLDATTVSQLRSYGIREGDLSKIDKMVADGFDPKEIAQSLRKNGNNNLASVIDQVPRRPKAEPAPQDKKKDEKVEKQLKKEEKKQDQQDKQNN
ncbi:hypothetical protein DFP93_12353 [Aneurinibacillus soli]|uniref:Uncharacterized protein n=1 Tax=Aneurinibacillus soli TaxID=1500254 RepID=A0A0U4WMD1_9BACL|nr:hypothetical protein [Aneurinibacillus soli]PYE58507.1 hypothetical protein DFP93_12353 [Aneurinibacillus soli]BAU29483.1 hypothetical protein CB4_03683 [Aneurinibacillus soli]